MILGHLSDLHLRDDSDVAAFERQLDRIVARKLEHVVITGDLASPAPTGRGERSPTTILPTSR